MNSPIRLSTIAAITLFIVYSVTTMNILGSFIGSAIMFCLMMWAYEGKVVK